MPAKQLTPKYFLIAVMAILLSLSVVACNNEQTPQGTQTFSTQLLSSVPAVPLAINKPVTVRSRTGDPANSISHVELYGVELPNGQTNVLLRSDAAPFDQTTFTAIQSFVPKAPGDYLIKVVGYNKLGEKAESGSIRFTAQ